MADPTTPGFVNPVSPVSPVKSYGSKGSGSRTRVAIACTVCDARNYQTTRKPGRLGQLSLKKFCPKCNRHTVHKETK